MDFSAGTLFASMIVSCVGMGLLLYGKKQTRVPQIVCGIVMMILSYLLHGPLLLLGAGSGLTVLLILTLRLGF